MYTFESRIRYSETGEDRRLTLVSLIDYFQDCSTFQSEDLGVGLSYMEELGAAWILNFWQIDILRLPLLGEKVVTGTSPYGFKGFIGYRNFMMETADGERLSRAASVWSLMDLKNLRPVRPTELMLSRYELSGPFDMEYEERKIRLPLADAVRVVNVRPVRIEEEHLDTNHHVNNARFAAFAVTAVQEAGIEPLWDRFSIEYKKQAKLGDMIWPVVFEDEKGCVTVGLMDTEWAAADSFMRDKQSDSVSHLFAAARFRKTSQNEHE